MNASTPANTPAPATADRPPKPPIGRAEPARPSRQTCIAAGLGLVLMAAFGGFGYFVAVDGLVTPGEATTTAADIMASEALFRLGIISLFVVIALDVVVAWALYRIFAPVNRTMSRLAAGFRYVYAGVFAAAVMQLADALRELGAGQSTEAVHVEALLKIDAFNVIWDAGLILFGVHLLVIAYLAYLSGFLPKFLGVLLGVAGFGYVFDSFAALLLTGPPPEISTVTFIGELLLALWLLIGNRRISARHSTVTSGRRMRALA